MKGKFKIDIKMIKRGVGLFLLVALLTVFAVVIIQSFNPNHVYSQSIAPNVLIPDGSYKDFLKLRQGFACGRIGRL